MPSALCQWVGVQRWARVKVRFQVRRARERSQRMVRGVVRRRELWGVRRVVWWR